MSQDLLGALLVPLVAAVGLLAPRVTAALPPPVLGRLPEGEAPPPSYPELAARSGLRAQVVLGSAALAGLVVVRVEAGWAWAYLLPVVPVLVLLAVIDWHTRLLPSRLVLPATAAVLALATAEALGGDWRHPLQALICGVLARSFFWLLWRIRSAGMGFGDVRLAALIGLSLGRGEPAAVAVGIYAAFVLFAVPGVLLALVRRDRRVLRRAYPFGPFLVAGAAVGIAVGSVTLPGWS